MANLARLELPLKQWQPGTTIVVQEIWHDRLWSARPMSVVEDHGDALVLWCPKGTRWKTATTPPSRPRAPTRRERFVASLSLHDWVLGDFVWDVSTLVLVREHDWHATWVSWRDNGDVWGWYINFQRPFVRTQHALRTMDLMLDITVDQDRRWQWKDRDEWDAVVAAQLIDVHDVSCVVADSERVIADIEANSAPFGTPWHDWRPDTTWLLPELPTNWDEL